MVGLDRNVKQGHSRILTEMKTPSVMAIFTSVIGTSCKNTTNHSRKNAIDPHKTSIFSPLFASSPKLASS